MKIVKFGSILVIALSVQVGLFVTCTNACFAQAKQVKSAPSPKDVYLKYNSIMTSPTSTYKDIEPYQSASVKEEVKDTPIPIDQAMMMIKAMAPKNVKVIKEEINGNKATLKLTGDEGANPFGGDSKTQKSVTTGEVQMVLENGKWLVDKEKWHTKISSGDSPAITNQAERDWCLEIKKMEFPRSFASGTIGGQPIKVTQGEISQGNITLQEGNATFPEKSVRIFIFSDKDNFEDTYFVVDDENQEHAPHIHLLYKKDASKDDTQSTFVGSDGYAMKLHLGKAKDGKLPCYILLRTPDKDRSHVEGFCELKIEDSKAK